MHWVRKPRLNSAVATVAVLMVLSLLRVVSLSLVMCFVPVGRHSAMRQPNSGLPEFGNIIVQVGNSRLGCAGPESITTIGGMDSELAAAPRPGMTGLVNRRLADRRTE